MIEKLKDSTKIQRVYELESKSFGEFVSYKPATHHLQPIIYYPYSFSTLNSNSYFCTKLIICL